jgi:hypothetical protein
MATVGDVALGIANQLATITGLDVADYVPDTINAPAGFVMLTAMTEDTLGAGMGMTFDAVVLTSRANDRVNQRMLYDYASASGPNSVWAAFFANPGLGLTDGTMARVVNVRHLRVEEIAAFSYFGLAFVIEVTTPA